MCIHISISDPAYPHENRLKNPKNSRIFQQICVRTKISPPTQIIQWIKKWPH